MLMAAGASMAVSAACGGTPAETPSPAAPAAGAGATNGATATPASNGGSDTAPTRVNINEIFPPGPGRDLVLNNCQNCHTFVPIVILQMEEAAWTRNSVDHRPRVTGLSDADFKTIYDYLKANFNPQHPVPALPRELLDTWTGY
jgi:hypothetical protein